MTAPRKQQALILGSRRLLLYVAVMALPVSAFVRFHEKPVLARTFGEQYERYCANVHRWVPRLYPWDGAQRSRFSYVQHRRRYLRTVSTCSPRSTAILAVHPTASELSKSFGSAGLYSRRWREVTSRALRD